MPARMRMRWTAYAGVSTALATGVILKALAQRPNFYSAAVYLSQSSANLMILTNLMFVIACSFVLGLQKLLYGNLRPIEVEQLYEKAWFAVTETCLAMTVFRGEIGLTFLAMFFSLLTGKVWGWIGEGRVEVLEQQPPRNPRLFHTRLALSLGLSVAFDLTMLEYVVKQVMRMARPDMMVMFGFEFAVLSIMSMSTATRYAIDLVEIGIVREQKRQRVTEIKKERVQAAVTQFVEAQVEQAANLPAADTSDATTTTPTPTQRTRAQVIQEAFDLAVDENEIEVEGWEEKGRYMFYLNLATDFFKLVIYLAFFFILLVFYGLPIHILRDVFLTMRSFVKRISDFMKYRTATRDMNAQYPDATAEDIGREDVCIICREEMHAYHPPAAEPGQPQPRPNPLAERMRPKKLSCGHVLHFSCLRSWLERQQICPTCRANVVQTGAPQGGNGAAGQAGVGQANGGQQAAGARQGPRVYQFGPLRIGVGAARGNNMFEELQQHLGGAAAPGARAQPQNPDPNAPQQFGVGLRWSRRRRTDNMTTQQQLDALDARIGQDIQELAQNSRELTQLRSMQTELQRLRGQRAGGMQANGTVRNQVPATELPPPRIVQHRSTTMTPDAQHTIIPAGSDRLPAGLTLPEGWTMMPLQQSQQITHQHQPNGHTHIHHPGGSFAGMQTFPQAFQQTQFHMMPQPMLAPQFQMRPPTDAAVNGRPAAPEVNGVQQVPPVQSAGAAAQPGAEMRFSWPQWGMPNHEQIHQQAIQQHQQHEQWLAGQLNQNGHAPAGAINNANGIVPQPAPTTPSGTGPVAGSTAADERAPAADAPPTSTANRPALPSWGSTVADAGDNGPRSPQANGHHDHAAEEPVDSSSRPVKKQPTVEDSIEDPD